MEAVSELLTITEAEYLGNYTIRIRFSNGDVRTVDFLPLLKGEWLGQLKSPDKFVQFALDGFTIEWTNGAGFATEYLYEIGK